jgi:hypothetical protein
MIKILNGHKSAIAATLNVVAMWAISRGYIPEDVATLTMTLLSIWTGIAVGHNMSKIGKSE